MLPPGGGKIFIVLGALLYAEKKGLLDKVEHWIGCSAGAMVSLLKVMGYTTLEIISMTSDLDIFSNVSFNIDKIKKTAGLIDHSILREPLETAMRNKFNKLLTLEELYLETGIEYTSIVTRLDTKCDEAQDVVYYNYKDYPNVSAIEATIRSGNIPGIFECIVEDDCYYVDGAFTNPFPINIDVEKFCLAIYIITESDPSNFSIWYSSSICYSSLNQIRRNLIKDYGQNCDILKLICPRMALNGLRPSIDDIGTMLGLGHTSLEKFIEKK